MIYPYMANGSLQDRLHGQVRAWLTVWELGQVAWKVKDLGWSRGDRERWIWLDMHRENLS